MMRLSTIILALAGPVACSSEELRDDATSRSAFSTGVCTSAGIEAKGIVLIRGGKSQMLDDGSIRLTSPEGCRSIEVLCDGSRAWIVDLGVDFVGSGFEIGAGAETPGPSHDRSAALNGVKAHDGLKTRGQSGALNQITAHSALIRRLPDGSRVVEMSDVLLDGDSTPIPTVSLRSAD